ncbi:alpha/beta fold hydrolase [Falsibacillus pallidus]|uniref:Pimeloyl-ACP methyl ester carboxylesterase n=1 Tax=Falsibacillus pallidus TaxID=493781 RepID=A0A370FZ57_9BACI|nr:alpha/beta hydrolase [Falsibacillus pallidus]RDI36917.1 pimeloyl-ACP methyl ester carboxylesterase [Falsibacillus pallidus]
MDAVNEKHITVNGIELFYEEYTNPTAKHTLVLLHGFLSSTFSYRRLIPLLRKDFQVISVDLPPFGKSGKTPSFMYSYKNIAHTVLHFIEMMNWPSVHVIGHSMGGQIALYMMKLRPDLIKKGILLCSSGYHKRLKWPLILSSYLPFFHYYVKFWLAKSGVRKNIENVVHNTALIDDDMMYGYLRPFLNDEIFIALTRMIRDREGDLTTKMLNEIDTPCLLIWGQYDKVVPLSIGEKLTQDLPKSKLIVLEETGHLVPEEKPEEVKKYIDEFIAEGILV